MIRLLRARTNWWHLLGTIVLVFLLSALAVFGLFILWTDLLRSIFGSNSTITMILVVFGIPLFTALFILYRLGNSSMRMRPVEAKSYLIASIALLLAAVYITYKPISKEFRSETGLSEKEERVKYLLERISNPKNGKSDQQSARELASLMADIAGKWQELKSDSGNFSILFPPYTLHSTQTTYLLDNRNLIVNHYTLNAQDITHDNLAYSVDYTHMPWIRTKGEIEKLFNNQRDFVISATNATLEFEKQIDTLSYPGRDLYLTIDGGDLKTHYHMYFHDGVFYKLMVVTREGKLFNKSITKFLYSFRILEVKEMNYEDENKRSEAIQI